MKKFFHNAPWWIISSCVTLMVLAVASVIHLAVTKKKEPERVAVASIAVNNNTQKIDPVPEEKEITAAEIPFNNPLDNPVENAEPAVFMPEAMISNHNESADGEDSESLKGNPNDPPYHFDSPGDHFTDVIGINSGSGPRGGKFGDRGGGGIRDLTNREGGIRDPRGPRPITQRAMLDGLKWLARHQSPDGSWQPADFSANCKESACNGHGQSNYSVGCTGLALLAFLGAGYNHQSRESWVDPVTNKRIIMGHVIRDGLKYLIEQQKEDGSISPTIGEFFYNHSIATLALAEGYGLSNASLLKEPAQNALNYLMRNQTSAPSGSGFLGWKYVPGDRLSDTSVTGWAIMALKSAEISGLQIVQSSYDGGLQWIRSVTNSKFQVGYMDREDAGLFVKVTGVNDDYKPHDAMTAVGMLIRTFTEHNINDPALEKGAEFLVKDTPRWSKEEKSNDYYYWYYASLALNQFDGPDSPRKDGKFWKAWNEDLVKALVPNQRKDGCFAGSWDSDDRWGHAGGRIYATAINTLTLEVYYRYENAFGGKRAHTKTK